MKTIIYRDIKKTTYNCMIDDMCFHFSSLFNLTRFKNNVNYYVNEEELKIRNKYQLELDIKKYLLIVFYKKIEKRGFYVSYKGKELSCYNLKTIIENGD